MAAKASRDRQKLPTMTVFGRKASKKMEAAFHDKTQTNTVKAPRCKDREAL
jgi:hypothetical protein